MWIDKLSDILRESRITASREKRLKEGIPIPKKLGAQIRAICERSGVAYPLG